MDHGTPLAVHNHKIVCIPSRGEAIAVGDSIAMQRPSGSWCAAKVIGIQIDGVPVSCTPAGRDVDVGLEIDGRCKPSYAVRTGVSGLRAYRPAAIAVTALSGPARVAHAEALQAEVQMWVNRRDEAYAWLNKNGHGGQRSWLHAEYERCCHRLEAAHAALRGD